MERVQKRAILKDLEKKLVLLVGPRQSGKTWLSKDIARNFAKSVYLNYDQPQDRKIMVEQSWLDSTNLLILDELHKIFLLPFSNHFLPGVGHYFLPHDNQKQIDEWVELKENDKLKILSVLSPLIILELSFCPNRR